MYKLALIAAGGVVGTLGRYFISLWIDGLSRSSFPFGTLGVNWIGCFAAGFLFQFFAETYVIDENLRLAVFTGFLGGFTTFSAYGLQTFLMAGEGTLGSVVSNVLLSNVGGLALVWVGNSVCRSFFPGTAIG